MTLFTPPVDVREKELEHQRQMGREAHGAAAEEAAEAHAPEVSPEDHSGGREDGVPPVPLPVKRILVQSLVTAVAVVAIGVGVWQLVVQRELEEQRLINERIQASLKASSDQLRVDQAQLRTQIEGLETRNQELSDQLIALEARRDRLNTEITAKQSELDTVVEQHREFNETTQRNRDENESLKTDNEVLQQQNTSLRAEEEALAERLKELNRESLEVFSRNKRVTAESDRLATLISGQRAALNKLSARLLDISDTVAAQRERLVEAANTVEEARKGFAGGLASLAQEYGKIASRNYGPVRLRYAAFARDVRAQLAEINAQAVDLDFAEVDVEEIRRQVTAFERSASVLGKSAEVRHLPGFDETAERINAVLVEAGMVSSVKEVPVADVGTRVNQITYFSSEDDVAAEHVHGLVSGGGDGFEVLQEGDTTERNFVIWIAEEASAPPAPDERGPADLPPGIGDEETPVPDAQSAPPADGGNDVSLPAGADLPPSANRAPAGAGDGIKLPPGLDGGGGGEAPEIEIVPSKSGSSPAPSEVKEEGGGPSF